DTELTLRVSFRPQPEPTPFRQLPNRRGRESAARAGIFRSLSTGQATNRLYIYMNEIKDI
ncbi:hypothetical protein SS51_19900, partial [Enterobacter roggenkampii]